jgi:hypothetical protein
MSMKLTPWSIVLGEKLIVTQLIKELSAYYETRRLITFFVRALHFSPL